jgi:hypothetical protein
MRRKFKIMNHQVHLVQLTTTLLSSSLLN